MIARADGSTKPSLAEQALRRMWRDRAPGFHIAVASFGLARFDGRSRRPAPCAGQRTPDDSIQLLSGEADSSPSERVLFDPAVQPAQYVAQHPNPNEPLGFEGRRSCLARPSTPR